MNTQNSKKLIVFDMDGTLAESKTSITKGMSYLLCELLKEKLVAIISGSFFPQFEKQLLYQLPHSSAVLKNLFLLPTSGSRFYLYKDNEWSLVYAHNLTPEEKSKILNAFERVFRKISYKHPSTVYGEVIEDRGTQIAFSPLGQDVVDVLGAEQGIAMKQAWNKKYNTTREIIAEYLRPILHEFEVRLGGLTTIDVTRKGIDKGYGILQIEKFLNIPKIEMLFIGDALYEGGNDYPVMREGVETISVKGPEDTKKIIQSILNA
ncbi:MAG: HAD-IIB family hydrolase [bacterium]|nr:HAD-IIB family hydrolase [bacterium]